MSLADLRRLIKRATPRYEDHRAPDRQDILRKEYGHQSFREVVDALDALEFSAGSFAERMREHLPTEEPTTGATPMDVEAAKDGKTAAERFAAKSTVDHFCAPEAGEGDKAPAPSNASKEYFVEKCRAGEADNEQPAGAVSTALHGLFRAIDGVQFASPGFTLPAESGIPAAGGEEEAGEGAAKPEEAAAARAKGGEKFKKQDFLGAIAEYTTAIRATARGAGDLHTLYSNRSAARLKLSESEAALKDARRCVQLAPQWPKGYFREGSCARQLGFLAEATAAFRHGERLEPENKDWPKEIEATEQLRRKHPAHQVRQLLFNMLPELINAWVRGAEGAVPGGVLQVQARGELKDLGAPKWQMLRDTKQAAKAQCRIAYLDRKDYLANLAANVASPPDGVAKADFEGRPMKMAEYSKFLAAEGSEMAAIHLDIQGGSDGKWFGLLVLVPCDADMRQNFMGVRKDPRPPPGAIDQVVELQKKTGFPKGMPKLLGFWSLPGDLNFPVIDLKRDMPSAS